MPYFRISQAAGLLGVSDDTVRRWVDRGSLPAERDEAGRLVVDGVELARVAQAAADTPTPGGRSSARNRFTGLVTRVVRDTVMAQVDVQAGPFRMVALVSAEAVDDLRLEPGSLVVCTVKATNLGLEVPDAD
ncbi:MAG: helix-turn-helix transcriptional regulator [Candidatus Nanopelagicales bacterium]